MIEGGEVLREGVGDWGILESEGWRKGAGIFCVWR